MNSRKVVPYLGLLRALTTWNNGKQTICTTDAKAKGWHSLNAAHENTFNKCPAIVQRRAVELTLTRFIIIELGKNGDNVGTEA